MTVPVQGGSSFVAGNPTVAAEVVGAISSSALGRNYDVSPDGRRFLILKNAAPTNQQSNPTRT
jgi:hypothetical protein